MIRKKAFWRLCLAASLAICSCASPGMGNGRASVGQAEVTLTPVIAGLKAGGYTGLASAIDGTVFLLESGGWRVQAYSQAGGRLYEMALPSARCLLAGAGVQGTAVLDLVGRQFLRYDLRGQEAFRAGLEAHDADALCLTASGEAFFLDADAGEVAVRDQGFRLTRRWPLRPGGGRPQSMAVDQLEGLVVVSFPGEGRIETYSQLGAWLDGRPLNVAAGYQSLAFDTQGRLWASCAGGRVITLMFQGRRWVEVASTDIQGLRALAPGPGGSVLALTNDGVLSLICRD